MKVDNNTEPLHNRRVGSASFRVTDEGTKSLPQQDDPVAPEEVGPVLSSAVASDNNNHDEWRIILYYCYIDIDEVDQHVEFQQHLCETLQLQGRIRVSAEGINGVLSGVLTHCKQYEERLRAELTRLVPLVGEEADLTTWELDVKYCQLRTDLPVPTQLFDSLTVKATNCVVSLFEPGLTQTSKEEGNPKKHHSKQSNRRKRRQQQRRELQQQKLLLDNNLQELATQTPSFPGGQHLSPLEWNQKLGQAEDAVLLDCRNVYESNVGYFQAPNAQTLLTNTRKYSDLPQVLAQSKDQWVHKKQIFMYCTGGVRCEQASKFVQALVATEQGAEEQKSVEVYQLHGGIQRYLEQYHNPQEEQTQQKEDDGPCLYRGLNFVFDPRRTDPMLYPSSCVGKCCVCGTPHDDYDNGNSPMENQEARCCKCRILLLVCPSCRLKVQCWGEEPKEGLPKLFCGIDECTDYQLTGANPVCAVPGTKDEK